MPMQNNRNADSRTTMVVPVGPIFGQPRRISIKTVNQQGQQRMCRDGLDEKCEGRGMKAGTAAPREIATEIVPGPVVRGMVRG